MVTGSYNSQRHTKGRGRKGERRVRKDWGFEDYRRPVPFLRPRGKQMVAVGRGRRGEGEERPSRIEIERKKPEEGAEEPIPRRERMLSSRISCD